jgi:hypothetical protein
LFAAGAINNPLVELIALQVSLHVTGRFALNCSLFNANRELLVGVMLSDVPLTTLAVVAATCPLPFVALAVMMQLAGVAGAVNSPDAEIAPQAAEKLAGRFAVNCCVAPVPNVGFTGEIVNCIPPDPTLS